MLEDLNKLDDLFYSATNLLDRAVVARLIYMYTIDWPDCLLHHSAHHSLHPFPNFYTWSNSVNFFSAISTSLVFELPSFQNEAAPRYRSITSGANMMQFSSQQI